MKISSYEKKNYVLKDKTDLIILSKIKMLETKKLSNSDKSTIKLIKTQLKRDWRMPLINSLNKLITKYKK